MVQKFNMLMDASGSLSLAPHNASREIIRLDYRVYEVSHSLLGIVAPAELPAGAELYLDLSRSKPLPVKVEQKIGFHPQLQGYRYRIRCLDSNTDCEKILPEISQRRLIPGDTNPIQVQYIRFAPAQPLSFTTKTFGSLFTYQLSTDNLSKSGLLLESSPSLGFRVPYCEGTLLELEFQTSGQEPIHMLGRVSRCEYDLVRKIKRLGISIKDLSQEMSQRYDHLVDLHEPKEAEKIKTIKAA